MTLRYIELFSVTDALNNYELTSTNQIAGEKNQRVCEIILTGNGQKLFSGK